LAIAASNAEGKTGLSEEKDTSRQRVTRQLFPENHIVTDQMVGHSWDEVADLWFEGYSEFGFYE